MEQYALRFHISTLGCKVNQHESDVLAAALSAHGWQRSDDGEMADVCIVNTCTVTQKASMQSRQLIRKLQRHHPGARIIVTGCYAQVAPEEIEAIEGVHAIVGHSRRDELPDIIVRTVGHTGDAPIRAVDDLAPGLSFFNPATAAPGARTRPFLKIQDGCNSFCTYCIVPYARGRSRSMRPGQVIRHLRHLGQQGYHEVVLTGIHLGAYGLDLQPATDLLTLLERIEAEKPLARIRLSSIEPHELSDGIIARVAASAIFCAHFHLPLQSGDDAILKRMHRPYSRDFFRQRVATIAARLPRAAIGADVLIGFPGEDDRSFEKTAGLLEELPISYLHVFPYSRRPGTPAFDYPNQVPPQVAKERTAHIRAIGNRKKQAFLKKAIGQKTEVLVENRRDRATGRLKGLSGNYLSILLDGEDRRMNTIAPAIVQDMDDTGRLRGRIIA